MLYDYSQWLYGLNISTFVLNLNFKQEILCNLHLMILQCKSTSFVKCLLQFHELNEFFSNITVTLEMYTGILYNISADTVCEVLVDGKFVFFKMVIS